MRRPYRLGFGMGPSATYWAFAGWLLVGLLLMELPAHLAFMSGSEWRFVRLGIVLLGLPWIVAVRFGPWLIFGERVDVTRKTVRIWPCGPFLPRRALRLKGLTATVVGSKSIIFSIGSPSKTMVRLGRAWLSRTQQDFDRLVEELGQRGVRIRRIKGMPPQPRLDANEAWPALRSLRVRALLVALVGTTALLGLAAGWETLATHGEWRDFANSLFLAVVLYVAGAIVFSFTAVMGP